MKGRLVSYDGDASTKKPGDFWFFHGHMGYCCPHCGELRQIPIDREKFPRTAWTWDGNEESPTITPSILHIVVRPGDCNWHGHLIAGEWRTAP